MCKKRCECGMVMLTLFCVDFRHPASRGLEDVLGQEPLKAYLTEGDVFGQEPLKDYLTE